MLMGKAAASQWGSKKREGKIQFQLSEWHLKATCRGGTPPAGAMFAYSKTYSTSEKSELVWFVPEDKASAMGTGPLSGIKHLSFAHNVPSFCVLLWSGATG